MRDRFSLQVGASKTRRNKHLLTPKEEAQIHGHAHCARLLDAQSLTEDILRMHRAAERDDTAELASVLERRCFDVDSKDEHGSTALHIAAARGNFDACRLLHQASAFKRHPPHPTRAE